MTLDLRRAKAIFNKTAMSYTEAAIVPREIGARLLARLSFIQCAPETIVELGSGCGTLLSGLQQQYPNSSLIGIDIAWARNQLAKKANHSVITADFQQLPLADHSVDLLISNLAFHHCLDLVPVFAEIHRVLKPDGILLFATFGPDTLQQLRKAFASADKMKHVLPFYDLHDIGDLLLHQGFKDPVTDAERLTVEYTKLENLFADLQAMGETNSLAERRKTLTGKKRWHTMLNSLEHSRNPQGNLPISFEISYGYAFGTPPVVTHDTPQEYRINVSDIKKLLKP